jgi:hypothetical protein
MSIPDQLRQGLLFYSICKFLVKPWEKLCGQDDREGTCTKEPAVISSY